MSDVIDDPARTDPIIAPDGVPPQLVAALLAIRADACDYGKARAIGELLKASMMDCAFELWQWWLAFDPDRNASSYKSSWLDLGDIKILPTEAIKTIHQRALEVEGEVEVAASPVEAPASLVEVAAQDEVIAASAQPSPPGANTCDDPDPLDAPGDAREEPCSVAAMRTVNDPAPAKRPAPPHTPRAGRRKAPPRKRRQAPDQGPSPVDVAPDIEEIKRALALIVAPGDVVEARVFGVRKANKSYRVGLNYVGYFDDMNDLAKAVAVYRRGDDLQKAGIFITPNPVKPGLLLRSKNVLSRGGSATTDPDIKRRLWLLVDVDPDRVVDGDIIKGIPADAAEHESAMELATVIKDAMMMKRGWPAPLRASSGNGAHLMWRIDLPNDDDAKELVNACLATLDSQFSADGVKVDTCVGNAARIWKLYGTPSWKGSPDEPSGRVHRVARVFSPPDPNAVVTLEQLEELAQASRDLKADEAAQAEAEAIARVNANRRPTPNRRGAGGAGRSRVEMEDFSIDEFIASHIPGVSAQPWSNGGRKWTPKVCPMNHEHADSSAYIGELSSGEIVAGCHHDSCPWGWQELREHFEPLARERRERAEDCKRRIPPPARIKDAIAGSAQPSPPGANTCDDPDPSPRWRRQPTDAQLSLRLGLHLDGGGERVIYAEGGVWRYDADTGAWGIVYPSEMVCRVLEWDGEDIVVKVKGEDKVKGKVKIGARNSLAALALLRFRREHEGRLFFERRAFGFCVDGEYIKADVDAGEVTQHPISPDWRVTAALPCAYDPDTRGPLLQQYLNTVHQGKPDADARVRLMGELCFVALCGLGPHFNRAILCYGGQGTGKSQFLEILSGLVPRELTCAIQPHELADDYKGAMLAGKLLNVVSECDESGVMKEAGFKAVVSGDEITRRKIRSEPFKFRPQALHVFAGNRLPPAPGVSDAFLIRWLLVGFERTFRGTRREVKNIGCKIIAGELAAVVSWAVDCGRGLVARGHYTVPASTDGIFARWRIESDNVAAWAEERTEELPVDTPRSSWWKLDSAYRAYSEWCAEGGFRRVNKSNFSNRLEAAGFERGRSNGVRFRLEEVADDGASPLFLVS